MKSVWVNPLHQATRLVVRFTPCDPSDANAIYDALAAIVAGLAEGIPMAGIPDLAIGIQRRQAGHEKVVQVNSSLADIVGDIRERAEIERRLSAFVLSLIGAVPSMGTPTGNPGQESSGEGKEKAAKKSRMSDQAFWTEARCVGVRFERRDPPLERLIAELWHVSGIYSLEVAGHVLRIGLSGQRTTRNETSGLGQRLLHHLDAAYGDQAARKAEFYEHFEFHAALIGRAMTIRWMPCPHETLRLAERAAIDGAPGGVLWERLRSERLAVKRDPARRGALANLVKAALDEKAATTKRRSAAAKKAALTKRRRAAGKKTAATRRANVTRTTKKPAKRSR